MKRLLLALMVVTAASAPTWADHQRVVYYDFSDPNDIFKASYWGTDDNFLKSSDFVNASGLDYIDNDPTISAALQGMIGIDNRQGTDARTGSVTFHIDNWDRPWDLKLLDVDERLRTSDIGLDLEENITVPDGYTVGPGVQIGKQLPPDYSIEPNPPWEEITWGMTVPAGDYLLIDEVTIVTDCIPEPATVALLTLSAGALVMLRRKQRK